MTLKGHLQFTITIKHMRSDIICSLDIGSSSIRTLIAKLPDLRSRGKGLYLNGNEEIVEVSSVPTKGFSKGVVSNLALLSDAVEESVSKAERSAHCRVRSLITGISGVHIRTFKSRGSVHISDRPSEITQGDIKRCIESAKLIAMSLDREAVHLIAERFYIDDKMEIDDPLGLFGSKLDVDLNIITSLVSILQNLIKAVNLAGYEVEDVVISGAGTALAVFDRKEMEEGSVIIDVGKDLTELALFNNGKLRDCFYFPFGSDDLTAVLQDKLKIMFNEAEDLRIKYGIIKRENHELYEDGPIRLSGAGEEGGIISRREISNLLFPKVEEIMQDIYKKVEPFLRDRKKLPRICVIGGISKMDGFVEAVEDIFCVPVDMGTIWNMKDLHDTSFATCLGLVRYGINKQLEKKSVPISDTDTFIGRAVSKARALLSEYF